MHAGKFDEALQTYRLAINSQPDDTEEAAKLHSNISATLSKLGNYRQAVDASNTVIGLQPSWEKGYIRKAYALISLQQYAEAAESIEQALHRVRGTAGLLEAKQVLLDITQNTQKRQKAKYEVAERPLSSLQAALSKLQTAGMCVTCWRNLP